MDRTRSFTHGELKFMIRRPNLEELTEAQKIQTKAFHDALNNGAILRAKLDEVLRTQGLWSDEKEIKLKTLQAEIGDLEVRLLKGGIKLTEAEKIAFEIIDKRDDIKKIFGIQMVYDAKTAEAMSEDARTDYLISVCLVYDNKENTPYFKDLADYLNQQDSLLVAEAYKQYLYFVNDTEDNPQQNLTEYKFLRKYGKVDSKLRLINKDGHLIDKHGHLINEDNRFVNEKGELVDINGNPVDADGNYKFDEQPFLDDEGNPIQLPSSEIAVA